MPRPRTITDDDITTAAREVFVEHGPAASVARVAERLGVSHAALFKRAGSKERLMLDALSPGSPPAIEELRDRPPLDGARDRLVEILGDLQRFFRQVVPNLVVLKNAGVGFTGGEDPSREPPPVALRRALATWLQNTNALGSLDVGAPDAVAEGLLGAIEARCFNAHLGGDRYAPGADDDFVEHLVDGLLPEVRPRGEGPR